MRTKIGAVAAATALAGAILGSAPAHAATVPCRATALQTLRGNRREIVRFRTFNIQVEPQQESYAIGERAKIDLTVTRPAREDPLDLGVPLDSPSSVPAENVNLGIGIRVGDVFVAGFSTSDADGKATVVVKLPSYMRPGTASVAAYGWNVVHETPCLRVEEDGYTMVPEAFEVTR